MIRLNSEGGMRKQPSFFLKTPTVIKFGGLSGPHPCKLDLGFSACGSKTSSIYIQPPPVSLGNPVLSSVGSVALGPAFSGPVVYFLGFVTVLEKGSLPLAQNVLELI